MQGINALLFGLDLHAMAVPAISILEKIIRPLLIYAFLAIALRIAGKRELAQLNTLDFVVLLLLSNTVQNAIIGNDNSVSGGIIGAITLLVVNYFVIRFLFRHPKLETALDGQPDVLILDGVVNSAKLAKQYISIAELEEAAHKQGIDSLENVERAELDPNGEIFFVEKVSTMDKEHAELLAAMDALRAEIRELKADMNGAN
jgi:uncharacterized membrane protein YcaP (DUF421 family)